MCRTDSSLWSCLMMHRVSMDCRVMMCDVVGVGRCFNGSLQADLKDDLHFTDSVYRHIYQFNTKVGRLG